MHRDGKQWVWQWQGLEHYLKNKYEIVITLYRVLIFFFHFHLEIRLLRFWSSTASAFVAASDDAASSSLASSLSLSFLERAPGADMNINSKLT